jgi:regulatory protein spx
MVTLFSFPSCGSCRKARKWLKENNIPFKERNLIREPLKKDEIKYILQLTEIGTEEIISTRSKAFQKLDLKIETLSMKELYVMIEKQPSMLRHPIIVDKKRLQVGFNENEIRRFLPRSVRIFQLHQMLNTIE